MHVCIFGTGASGWMVAHSLKNLKEVTKITIIGSDKIPAIGVGESTTSSFMNWVEGNLNFTQKEYYDFIVNINASVKYGVSYEGWSPKIYLHGFNWLTDEELVGNQYLLANKPNKDNVNIYNSYVASFGYQNKIVLDWERHPLSWQFEANSLIETLQNLAKKEIKINHKIETLKNIHYKNSSNEEIEKAILEDGTEIIADYYVNSIGSTSFNQNIFKEQYEWYNEILLTNKAIFTPIEYKNKEKEIHPYTVAKTMKHGWRWITPTWNRIGTGYVFSDKHCSIEEAKKELAEDIGEDLNFRVVDFTPRKVKKAFKENYCSIGMASGFLEPLDAPGLSITIDSIEKLKNLITSKTKEEYKETLNIYNKSWNFVFNFWASFILLQYKTSHRNDTQFWKDHKNVNFSFLQRLLQELPNPKRSFWERTMFFNTIAGKDINWKIPTDKLPEKLDISNTKTIDHLELLNLMREDKEFLEKIIEENKIENTIKNLGSL